MNVIRIFREEVVRDDRIERKEYIVDDFEIFKKECKYFVVEFFKNSSKENLKKICSEIGKLGYSFDIFENCFENGKFIGEAKLYFDLMKAERIVDLLEITNWNFGLDLTPIHHFSEDDEI